MNPHPAILFLSLLSLSSLSRLSAEEQPTPKWLDQYDVTWTTPSRDASGSMPLGNGATSLNAWINPAGELECYLGRTDSWGDNGRLLKVGKFRITLDPPPPVTGNAYAQDLPQLPRCWADAIGAFETSPLIARILPDELVRNYLLTKRQEMRYYDGLSEAERVDLYLDTV